MTEEFSSKFIEASIERAGEALRGARTLVKDGELYGAVSRAYYCVFHAARALLHSKDLRPKTHSGLRALFGEHLIKTGVMSKEYADILRDVFDARHLSDYEVYAQFSRDEVESLVNKAAHFLKAVTAMLR